MGTVILGVCIGAVTEEVDTGSGGEETATAGDTAAAVTTNIQVTNELQPNKTIFLLLYIVCARPVVTVAFFRFL